MDQLDSNMAHGNVAIFNPVRWDPGTWPSRRPAYGWHEAPRGSLGHWVEIDGKSIKNYQAVVPTTWNAGPRDAQGQRGAYEASLLNTPVADPARPLEILRTIHSFDPCLACAVHVIDAKGANTHLPKASLTGGSMQSHATAKFGIARHPEIPTIGPTVGRVCMAVSNPAVSLGHGHLDRGACPSPATTSTIRSSWARCSIRF